MISYPSIDDLLKRYDSRYSLAVLSAKRAHQLEKGDPKMLSSYESPKTVGMALEEIAKGKVIIDPDSVLLEHEAEKKLKKQEDQ
ncbi:DNA-directed RNA polymerase subunit omega [Schleiferilactobacillus shenzhenensis]|uniref:DNA-directed RNA polymerase subunit omega n=1 Tax=Schleiferilactobacillus shenzhenensis LY-73 TaxID=1231336 RepID=U4TMX8_9LACO|nr:DNA-directed RNA polymerase subunit omega [Schleiferilactobacillus shenzhenensis]ERL65574.1 RpoZ [Schleiferilactobacillus shenzhenensis LY-73]